MMDVPDPNLRVFEGRKFYLLSGIDTHGLSTALDLIELADEPFSYALAYLSDERELVIDDHSWTGMHAPLPLEARVWFEKVARNALIAQQ